jgi:hypothetical protein
LRTFRGASVKPRVLWDTPLKVTGSIVSRCHPKKWPIWNPYQSKNQESCWTSCLCDEKLYQRVALNNISQTRAPSRFFHQNRRHGFASNDQIRGQFLKQFESTGALEYIKKRETSILRSREASLANLLLESFGSDKVSLKYLYRENDNVEQRVRGQNGKRIDRDAISREANMRMHISPRETHACI